MIDDEGGGMDVKLTGRRKRRKSEGKRGSQREKERRYGADGED